MANIIPLSRKLQNRKEKRTVELTERFRTLQRSLKRQRRGVRCEKCDNPVKTDEDGGGQGISDRVRLLPYKFCNTCAAEYVDYIDFLSGRKNTDCQWQNRQWAETWKRWIDYRGALDSYLTSKEFVDYTRAIELPEPEN